ncbi:unnamed protein product [Zymoseptoria tritici ST99CH_1A5]|uniref:C3H1-type domain-containing protein n=2 Tax=Zymoseptoria tritici TaxID=1047171 RepID=A0A1Y6L4Z0_ZYMTR|nr:unnamed protein product [Zymoseptoria tritici ST99CH_3D1]SMY19564.1 unnamed protein product [Zymoseptoria tritici ST99CH_1A5]
MSIPDVSSYTARLEAFQKSDEERNALFKDLVDQYKQLKERYDEKQGDYDNELASRRMWQQRASASEQALTVQKQVSSSHNFVVVLVDGDGAIFQDYLLSMGKEGGAEAAHQLYTTIKEEVKAKYPDAISDWSIVVQVVLNLQGLAMKLASCGIISSPTELVSFGRAFGLAQPLFSFVDVGVGKERADHKIRETLRLYLPIAQCKHIFFAPCHDNGYLPVFESYRRDPRLTLIETRPAEWGFRELGIEIKSFPKIFRTVDLPSGGRMPPPGLPASPAPPVRAPTIPHNTVPIMKPASPAPSTESNPPTTTSTNGSTTTSSSWATVGKTGVNSKTINIAPKKPPPTRKFVLLNAYDERLDTWLPDTDKSAELRYAKRMASTGKCCNDFYLSGKCEKGEYCDYKHTEKLTPAEVLVLKHKARSRSCPQRAYCRDVDCHFGHVCKFGKDFCNAENCWFASSHNTDTEPAKRYFEDGSEEWLQSYLDKFGKA